MRRPRLIRLTILTAGISSECCSACNCHHPVSSHFNSLSRRSARNRRAEQQAVVESAGLALRAQTEADLEAARWGLLTWEDPRERSKFRPFWIDEKMLEAVVVEPGDPVGNIARASGMSVAGLRLLDRALVLKVHRGRRVE